MKLQWKKCTIKEDRRYSYKNIMLSLGLIRKDIGVVACDKAKFLPYRMRDP